VQTNYKRLEELRGLGEVNARIAIEDFVAGLTAEYYNYVQQKIRLKNFLYAVSLSKERLRIVEARYRIGNFSRLDLQQARVDFNADSSQYINQQELVQASLIRLNELMAGPDVNAPLQICDSLIRVNSRLEEGELLKRMLQTNASLLKADRNTALAGLDLKACKNLESVKLNYNDYPAIDVSGCTLLQTIDCGYSDKTLETLNVTGCSSLKTLVINDSKLRELDLAGCPSLVTLTCEHGALQSLDLSPCKALSELNCNKNELTQLDISCCPEITTVEVPYNRLSEIDARANKNLEKLDVTYNEAGMNIYLLESHKAWPFELKKDRDANVFYE